MAGAAQRRVAARQEQQVSHQQLYEAVSCTDFVSWAKPQDMTFQWLFYLELDLLQAYFTLPSNIHYFMSREEHTFTKIEMQHYRSGILFAFILFLGLTL